ncbi:MAG: phosphatidylserine decarboxylase [Nitrospiraceae bacterium]
MRKHDHLAYYDRQTGALRTEEAYAGSFLFWAYNTRLGGAITHLLLRQKLVSQLYGWCQNQRWSRPKIRAFVERFDVNVDEFVCPLEHFTSFNQFFTREIDLSKRPITADPYICVAPADGKLLAYPAVDIDRTFRIKGASFNLCRFLRDDALAAQYAGGSMVISRLSFADYHHFHFPDSGVPGHAGPIQGKYYAVGPYALTRPVPFYAENYRMVTLFNSDHFGQIAMVEIGAFAVGSVHQRYQPGIHVTKGARKGFFQIGGSTVVLLFRRGAVTIDHDLCQNTQQGMETYVRVGDSIGRVSPAGDKQNAER